MGRSLGLRFASAYAKASAGQAGEAGDDTPSLKSSYGEAGEGDSVRELEISVDQRLKSNPFLPLELAGRDKKGVMAK